MSDSKRYNVVLNYEQKRETISHFVEAERVARQHAQRCANRGDEILSAAYSRHADLCHEILSQCRSASELLRA